MGINEFSDLTQQEFVNTYLTTITEDEEKDYPVYRDAGYISNGAVDWR